jgi:hypothetical protein
MHTKLDMSNSVDVTYWCSYLFAFFLMARKSNLVPVSEFCRHHYASPHETELVRTELLNEMPNWHHPFEMNVMSNWMDFGNKNVVVKNYSIWRQNVRNTPS